MIILGDFNALPFSQEISTTAGLWAVRDRAALDDRVHMQRDLDREGFWAGPFYNPMWDHLPEKIKDGQPRALDAGSARGTFRYNTPGRGIDWLVLDQVVVSHDLADLASRPEILTEVDGQKLTTEKGTMSTAGSDHLPVLLRLRID